MFCRACGSQFAAPGASICVACGTPRGMGNQFCPQCAAPTQPSAVLCLKCGTSLTGIDVVSPKSKIAAGLLGIFLGALGIHNFYLGYIGKGVVQLIVSIVGLFLLAIPTAAMGLWGLIEGIMILAGGIKKDGKGRLLVSKD